MGYYINPKDGSSKEEWLKAHAQEITEDLALQVDTNGDSLPVCLVDNGRFTAAGIGYYPREVEVFAEPDGRRKRWYLARISDLLVVCPELQQGLTGGGEYR
jgi:hypothetical protein